MAPEHALSRHARKGPRGGMGKGEREGRPW